MKRLIELDVLRAVLLLMMVVNHSPSQLRRFTDQPPRLEKGLRREDKPD
jgi:hypothetical protein